MPSISRIQIEQQFASIGITTKNAQMRITSPKPTMEHHNEVPKPNIDTKISKFKVNWQKVRGESGLKSPGDLALSNRDQARMKTSQAIDTFVGDGNYLSRVEQKGDRVAQLSRQETLKDASKTINLGLMPQSSPEFSWDPGNVNIEWSKSGLIIEWDSTELRPQVELDPPHSVEIFLQSKPFIRITVAEGDVPRASGQVVDRNI